MTDTPKRRFWQIHLSTAVLLMFVAAGLIGANFVRYDWEDGVSIPYPGKPGWFARLDVYSIGFPMKIYSCSVNTFGTADGTHHEEIFELSKPAYGAIVMNVTVGFLIIAIVCFVREVFIRRRERSRLPVNE